MAKTKLDMGGVGFDATLDGNILTITVDLSKKVGPSKSGKTTIIASSLGNQTIIGKKKIGLNVYE